MTSLALVGGQYGSEGKGVIAAGLAPLFHAAVRTGGPNAGHSFYHEDVLYKMRSVPCAWVNPEARLLLGAGAVVDPQTLTDELAALPGSVVVTVDPHAVVVTPADHEKERAKGLRELIGSTTEGVGSARAAKLKRDGSAVLAKDWDWGAAPVIVDDVANILRDYREDPGALVMLEGTQGALLSLHHGRYPYVTSSDTNAAQLAADAGLPPSDVTHTHLVVRTYPIRVAGNSGPTGGEELDWNVLIDQGLVAKPERTTVTKLQRRIFEFSLRDLEKAVDLNDPCGVWVTFGDYLDPLAPEYDSIDEAMDGPIGDFVRRHVTGAGLRLLGVGVGGPRWRVLETGDYCHRARGHFDRTWPLWQQNTETFRGVEGVA